MRAYSFAFDGSLSGHPDSFCIESEDGEVVIPLAGNWLAVSEVDFGIWASSNPMAPTPGNPNAPAALFDSMLNPLIPYALRGAIWYQGESNTRSNTNAFEYFMTLKTMINDWRYQWAQGNFPFIQVQLANYNDYDAPFNDYSSWAVLRDAQRLVCQALPNVFMASAIDIGDAVDIHPQDKKSVGFRLAQNAFANVYHFSDIVPSGPLYDGYELEGNKIRIKFKYADGLHLKKDHALSFVIAGAEHIFKVADQVEIDRDSILVSSDRIPHPLAVRYAWGNNPVSSLYNSSDLPASSFRTDDWQIKD